MPGSELDQWRGESISAEKAIELLRELSGRQPGVAECPGQWVVTMSLRTILDRVPLSKEPEKP